MIRPTSAQPTPAPHLKYRPDIDGLRVFAVLAVVIFHVFPAWLKGGFIGRFYITENPELSYPIEACYSWPFKLKVRDCSADRSKVLQRQGDYLEAFAALKNVTF